MNKQQSPTAHNRDVYSPKGGNQGPLSAVKDSNNTPRDDSVEIMGPEDEVVLRNLISQHMKCKQFYFNRNSIRESYTWVHNANQGRVSKRDHQRDSNEGQAG